MKSIQKHIDKFQKYYILLIGGIFLFLRIIPLLNINLLMDDAYISFRYAKNFSDGFGLVFNQGENVEGYTNFLWTIILSFCISIGFSVSKCAVVLSFISALGTMYIMVLMVYKFEYFSKQKWLAGLFAVSIFSLMGSQARYVMSGMETHLFTFLLSLSIYSFYFLKKDLLTGIFYGLASLCRPEGAMYLGIIIFFIIISNKRQYHRLFPIGLGFSLLFIPHLLWRFSYYGFIFPNTYYAKASGFSLQRISRGLSELVWVLNHWFYWPYLVLILSAIFFSKKSEIFYQSCILILGIFLYFIYVGGDFVIWFGPRFLLPLLPLSIVIILIGIWEVTYLLIIDKTKIHIPRIIIFCIILFLTLRYSWPTLGDKLTYFSHQMQGWRELSVWMNDNLPKNTTLATDAAGIIPFYTNFYTIDMYGLTDLHIAHLPVLTGLGTIAHEKYDPEYILEQDPDCIFSWINMKGEPNSAGLLAYSEEIRTNYSLIALANTSENGGILPWVIVSPEISEHMYLNGYKSGLFCKNLSPVTY
ncbi:MAG: hypothetical protein CVU40_10360 [Chloroflexi bacterium HGW-Chloroflexi-2]|nr:MAG: hypothetical protein CVU40_10360 [Chloroflexi bacterium HGW-Chloroflexi-2]